MANAHERFMQIAMEEARPGATPRSARWWCTMGTWSPVGGTWLRRRP